MSNFSLTYQHYIDLAQTDPIEAAKQYRDSLKSKKRPSIATIRILDRIIRGDTTAWHPGARDLTDAVQFIISNAMLKSVGLGVMNTQAEDIIQQIGRIISEDRSPVHLTTIQRRCISIAESYGLNLYVLPDTLVEGPALPVAGPKSGLKGYMVYHRGKPADLDIQEQYWNSYITRSPYPIFINEQDAINVARRCLVVRDVKYIEDLDIRPVSIHVGQPIPVRYSDDEQSDEDEDQ